jgi:aspartyl-tRNA(Asn)/glutamyl-tRNA(Gln) amidotransferase subunit B
VEIVTDPDMHTPEEARAYVAELRSLLHTLDVSDVRMEEGSLRADANVSIRPEGTTELGTKTEVKNMNSLRSLQRALAYEVERQTELLNSGKQILQETRHFDENTGNTIGGRAKEYSSDYRYFPDPDLVPMSPSQTWIDDVRHTIPELPSARRQRLVSEYHLGITEARSLTASKGLADAFEEAARAYGGRGGAIARWYLGELAQVANEKGVEAHEVGVSPAGVAELQHLIDDKKVSDSMAKGQLLKDMVASRRAPSAIVEESGIQQISDESELASIVDRVIAENPDVVEQIRGGKTGAVNFLKGQVMKETKGQADQSVVGRLLDERLGPNQV